MKKSAKFITIFICSALMLCSCGKKEKTAKSSKIKDNKEVVTTVPANALVVAPDVIEYDEDGNVIDATSSATDGQYIEINPFEGWNCCQFVRRADGRIMGDSLDWINSPNYKTLQKNELAREIACFTPDGKYCDFDCPPEGEKVIAVLREFGDKDALNEEKIEKVKADAKEKGIILTEVTREMVVTITREEPTEKPTN